MGLAAEVTRLAEALAEAQRERDEWRAESDAWMTAAAEWRKLALQHLPPGSRMAAQDRIEALAPLAPLRNTAKRGG